MAQSRQIPITKPYFTAADFKSVQAPLKSGWVVQGPFVAAFEEAIKKFTGAKHAVATTNCTTALHLGLIALGIKPDDHVIVPSFTWVSSANAIEYVGARPIFCDIDLKTFNIDLDHLEHLLKKDKRRKIKAVMPVHLFGLCADMKNIDMLAAKYGFKIIEDAACALDAFIGKQHAGTFGDVGCFSFHPRKIITTGEGGMIVTNNAKTAALCRRLRDHGAKVNDLKRHRQNLGLPDFDELGFNYRLTDIQAALGVSQMAQLKKIQKKRRRLANRYSLALQGLPGLQTPLEPKGFNHGYQAYVCLTNKRNHLAMVLAAQKITTRPGTHAVHTLGFYAKKYNLKPDHCVRSLAAQNLSLALPLYPDLSFAEQDRIIAVIKNEMARL